MILEKYREALPELEQLKSDVLKALHEALDSSGLTVTAIEARVKAEKSLVGKLAQKGAKYTSLTDITDLVGARVITFYTDDVDRIASIAEKLFEIDWANSVDKRKLHQLDSFGYNSLHYICRMPGYDFRFELQLRTTLQHAWAAINQAEIQETPLDNYLQVFKTLNCNTLGDVDRLIRQYEEDAYLLARHQLGNTDLDIISSSIGLQNVCIVYVLSTGGGKTGLERLFDAINGKNAYNATLAAMTYEQTKTLPFMK